MGDVLEKLAVANEEVVRLCNGQKFRMRIPADGSDSDLVLGTAIVGAQDEILRLRESLRKAERERDEARAAAVSVHEAGKRILAQRDEALAVLREARGFVTPHLSDTVGIAHTRALVERIDALLKGARS